LLRKGTLPFRTGTTTGFGGARPVRPAGLRPFHIVVDHLGDTLTGAPELPESLLVAQVSTRAGGRGTTVLGSSATAAGKQPMEYEKAWEIDGLPVMKSGV
jgi:hypothetical protein